MKATNDFSYFQISYFTNFESESMPLLLNDSMMSSVSLKNQFIRIELKFHSIDRSQTVDDQSETNVYAFERNPLS